MGLVVGSGIGVEATGLRQAADCSTHVEGVVLLRVAGRIHACCSSRSSGRGDSIAGGIKRLGLRCELADRPGIERGCLGGWLCGRGIFPIMCRGGSGCCSC